MNFWAVTISDDGTLERPDAVVLENTDRQMGYMKFQQTMLILENRSIVRLQLSTYNLPHQLQKPSKTIQIQNPW